MAVASTRILHRTLTSLALLAACTTSQPDTPAYKALPVSRCGMEPYEIIDPATLGEVVAFEEIDTLNLGPEAVNDLIAQTGFKNAPKMQYGSRVFRFRYTTQDRGDRIEATAMLGVPANVDLPDAELPSALFLHGTTGFSDPCSPGRSLDGQAPAALMAALGFVGVLPDYIGMNSFGAASTHSHGYLVGEQVAIGSWDALRAGLKLVKKLGLGVKVSSKTIIWGGSQGGHSALFTELYGPYYAPEFEVPGVVALVAPTTLPPLVDAAVTSFSPPTMSFAAVLATMREWYGEPANLSAILTDVAPYNFASTMREQLLRTEKCDTGARYSSMGDQPEEQKVDVVYRQSFIDAVKQDRWTELEPWACFFKENSLATSSVQPKRVTPTFLIYSEKDNLVVTAPMRDEFTRLCASGYRFDYLECQDAAHTQGAVWSLSEQVAWIRERLEGKPLGDSACTLQAPKCCSSSPADVCTP